jgi:YVTN family beta-propeller protein
MINPVALVFAPLRLASFLLVLGSLVLTPALTGAVKTKRAQAKKPQDSSPQKSPTGNEAKPSDQRVVYQGIAVDLSVKPVLAQKKELHSLREGDNVTFRLKITETATGAPLTGAHPAAWMNLRRQDEKVECTTAVKAFIEGGLLARPQLDLNGYYVLALNQDATISVIDPHFGYGGSKLFAMVSLKSPGEDWALAPGGKTLFVSLPDSNLVAIVNTATWKVTTDIDVGPRPSRIVVQPNGQNVWVGYGRSESNNTESGVAVIDSETSRPATRIPTGRGNHAVALSDDNRIAFVTNSDDGTVSIIDVKSLKKITDLQTGRKPGSIAFSPKAKMAYVTNEEDGSIVAIDGARRKVVARIPAAPGVGQIRFAPDGRFAFVANPAKDAVHVLDSATNKIIQTADISSGPDQVSFSNTLAYVRRQRSEIVLMLSLPQNDTPSPTVSVVDFPGGQHAFGKTSNPSPAGSIVQAPGADAVLVGNPADKSIYYYKEGMAAPMGSFSNYGREPRAILVVDRSLRERAPGVYETTAQLTHSGNYDLALLLDTPRVVHCFPIQVEANPDLATARDFGTVRIEPLINRRVVSVGEGVRLRFKLSDPKTKEPKVGLRDVGSLIFMPGIWQQRQMAKEVEKGIYEVEFEPPQSGYYYIYLESPSAGLKIDNPQWLVLQANDKESP